MSTQELSVKPKLPPALLWKKIHYCHTDRLTDFFNLYRQLRDIYKADYIEGFELRNIVTRVKALSCFEYELFLFFGSRRSPPGAGSSELDATGISWETCRGLLDRDAPEYCLRAGKILPNNLSNVSITTLSNYLDHMECISRHIAGEMKKLRLAKVYRALSMSLLLYDCGTCLPRFLYDILELICYTAFKVELKAMGEEPEPRRTDWNLDEMVRFRMLPQVQTNAFLSPLLDSFRQWKKANLETAAEKYRGLPQRLFDLMLGFHELASLVQKVILNDYCRSNALIFSMMSILHGEYLPTYFEQAKGSVLKIIDILTESFAFVQGPTMLSSGEKMLSEGEQEWFCEFMGKKLANLSEKLYDLKSRTTGKNPLMIKFGSFASEFDVLYAKIGENYGYKECHSLFEKVLLHYKSRCKDHMDSACFCFNREGPSENLPLLSEHHMQNIVSSCQICERFLPQCDGKLKNFGSFIRNNGSQMDFSSKNFSVTANFSEKLKPNTDALNRKRGSNEGLLENDELLVEQINDNSYISGPKGSCQQVGVHLETSNQVLEISTVGVTESYEDSNSNQKFQTADPSTGLKPKSCETFYANQISETTDASDNDKPKSSEASYAGDNYQTTDSSTVDRQNSQETSIENEKFKTADTSSMDTPGLDEAPNSFNFETFDPPNMMYLKFCHIFSHRMNYQTTGVSDTDTSKTNETSDSGDNYQTTDSSTVDKQNSQDTSIDNEKFQATDASSTDTPGLDEEPNTFKEIQTIDAPNVSLKFCEIFRENMNCQSTDASDIDARKSCNSSDVSENCLTSDPPFIDKPNSHEASSGNRNCQTATHSNMHKPESCETSNNNEYCETTDYSFADKREAAGNEGYQTRNIFVVDIPKSCQTSSEKKNYQTSDPSTASSLLLSEALLFLNDCVESSLSIAGLHESCDPCSVNYSPQTIHTSAECTTQSESFNENGASQTTGPLTVYSPQTYGDSKENDGCETTDHPNAEIPKPCVASGASDSIQTIHSLTSDIPEPSETSRENVRSQTTHLSTEEIHQTDEISSENYNYQDMRASTDDIHDSCEGKAENSNAHWAAAVKSPYSEPFEVDSATECQFSSASDESFAVIHMSDAESVPSTDLPVKDSSVVMKNHEKRSAEPETCDIM